VKSTETSSLPSETRFPYLIELLQLLHKDVLTLMSTAKNLSHSSMISTILSHYPNVEQGIEDIAWIVLELLKNKRKTIDVLQEMYYNYAPFRFSIENKETSLLIKNKRIIDDYSELATPEEKSILELTEKEAQITKQWILSINGQTEMQSKTITTNWNTPELLLLHKIQSKFLKAYRQLQSPKDNQKIQQLGVYIQMTILAISEALGFGG